MLGDGLHLDGLDNARERVVATEKVGEDVGDLGVQEVVPFVLKCVILGTNKRSRSICSLVTESWTLSNEDIYDYDV